MGIISVRNKSRQYSVQLEIHSQHRVELPIEKLHAVFLETTGVHGNNAREVAINLQKWGGSTGEIIERAKASGTEIWFGDVERNLIERITSGLLIAVPLVPVFVQAVRTTTKASRRDFLKLGAVTAIGLAAPSIPLFAGNNLAEPGDANNRTASRAIVETYGKLDPTAFVRNAIIADKVKALAERTGHTKIGLQLGSLHAGITDLLKADKALTEEQRSKIAARGSNALKMFRCKYNKKTEEWQVQEHSL